MSSSCWRKISITSSSTPFTLSPSRLRPLFNSLLRASHLKNQSVSLANTEQGSKPTSAFISREAILNLLSFSNSRSLSHGVSVHSPITKLGLHGDLFLCNQLLSLYDKCYGLDYVRKMFDEMPHRDVVSWTGVISAHARSGFSEIALDFFCGMLVTESCVTPNEFTCSTVLRCCTTAAGHWFDLGSQIHAQIWRRGFGSNTVIGGALLDFYSKCCLFNEAGKIFAAMDHRDAISWTTMISALVEAEDYSGAMELYASMISSGTPPTEFTFTKLLAACGTLGCHRRGAIVHAHLILWGMKLNLVLKTALVDMYSKCLQMSNALRAFRLTPESDVMLWTTMVTGYSNVGDFDEAITMFSEMEGAGVPPNSFTYAGVLSACSSVSALGAGSQIHCQMVKVGLEHHASVGNALVDLYSKCSPDVKDSAYAFQAIVSPNVVSWTALIAGLARHGRDLEAFIALTEMRASGVQPNSFTLSTVLKGCSSLGALTHARKIHAYVMKTKSDSLDAAVGNSLVDVYARFTRMEDAWTVASTMILHRDVVTYTSMAKGLNQIGHQQRSLEMMTHMLREGVAMDGFSLACFLSSAAGLSSTESGKQLHCYSLKSGLNNKVSVSNSLVDMYSKCGCIREARSIFLAIQEPNVVSWNGLISGLASNGLIPEALSTFEDMRLARAQPDGITFLVVLYACSHGGLVDVGIEHFNKMRDLYSVSPERDHYACLVDMLSRAGRLEEAACAIETMPFQPDASMYKTLLASCKLYGNLVLGESIARSALELDPYDTAIYMLLAGIYDNAGKLEWGEQTRRMMRERTLRKCPGQSWIQMTN
ncbi:pentatricopeptide repeat-containing protein At5g52850, chloroplastic [Typha angustifolia]|uniref:pentatricopeptide repeat-containing protein At5g52850, chloroplastic n=1 Tax=Typha angustifolia TaxID=59011 RepID=UPI003C2B3B81